MVDQLELLTKLSNLEGKNELEHHEQKVFSRLSQVKQNLLLAIKIEQLLREHDLSMAKKRSFLVELEMSLTALMLEEDHVAADPYANLYREMLEIGSNNPSCGLT